MLCKSPYNARFGDRMDDSIMLPKVSIPVRSSNGTRSLFVCKFEFCLVLNLSKMRTDMIAYGVLKQAL